VTKPADKSDLTASPVFLIATLFSARKSKDCGLEALTRRQLAELGIKIIFGDELPSAKKEVHS
jgi:hypothetical protein